MVKESMGCEGFSNREQAAGPPQDRQPTPQPQPAMTPLQASACMFALLLAADSGKEQSDVNTIVRDCMEATGVNPKTIAPQARHGSGRVLVGCERSGMVRRALRARGTDAWSNDLVPADDGSSHHIIGDVREVIKEEWAGAILFPDCTYLTVSGLQIAM